MDKEFCQRLVELRKEKGVFQKDVAKAIGVASNTITNYEKGDREPSLAVIKALCRYYQVSADYLLGLSDY